MEGIISEIAIGLALCAVFAMGVWCVWTIFKAMHDYLTNNHGNPPNEPEAPYKLEPEKPADNVALPNNKRCTHETFDLGNLTERSRTEIEWAFANAPELKSKRKYTKRSKYWTDKRKKAAAAKARKAKRKPK